MKSLPRLFTLLFFLGIPSLQAEDWPQFRGLNRDGISAETGLNTEWPVGGPKVLWQVSDLGIG